MNRILSPLMTVLRIHLRNVRATRECSRTYTSYAELCMIGNKSLPLLQVFALVQLWCPNRGELGYRQHGKDKGNS
jgi:hypothetical protein